MPSFVQKIPSPQFGKFGPKFGPAYLKHPHNQQATYDFKKPANVPDIEQGEENLPRIINYNADQGGCSLWRIIWPSEYMLAYKKATAMNLYQLVVEPYFYKTIHGIKFQRQCKTPQINLIRHIRKIADAKKEKHGENMRILWEVDDLVAPADAIPDFNKSKEPFNTPEILANLKELQYLVDEFIVVSEYMKQHYAEHAGWDNITVIPNYLPHTWLGNFYDHDKKMKQFEQNKGKPRIGYIGSASHFDVRNKTSQRDDFGHVFDTIVKTKDKYQWVFVGGFPLRLAPLVQKGVIEFHPWCPILELHSKVASLNLQATVAPLMDHVFNRSKSDIKMMESAALGIPCACQDLNPYEKALFKFQTGDEMMDQIESILSNYETAVAQSHELTNGRWLHEHLDEHVRPYISKKK